MRLRALIEAVLPTLLDDLDGYEKYELGLIALDKAGNELASSIILITRTGEDYTTTSTEVQIFEPARQNQVD